MDGETQTDVAQEPQKRPREGLAVNRRVRLISVAAVVVVLVISGILVFVLSQRTSHKQSSASATTSSSVSASATPATDADARDAAMAAANYTTHRAEVIDPLFNDNSPAVPFYPTGTTITLDQSSWVRAGESGSAYAQIQPQNQRVMIHFNHTASGHWHITQIETDL